MTGSEFDALNTPPNNLVSLSALVMSRSQTQPRISAPSPGHVACPSTTHAMMMSMATYKQIAAIIDAHSGDRDCLSLIAKDFPDVSPDTLLSIYSQQYQLHTKRIHGSHRRPESMETYYKEYQIARQKDCTDRLLLDSASKVSLSPTLYARIILEQFALKNSLVAVGTAPNLLVSQWIKSPSTIPDDALQKQVKLCILNDPNYGPMAENIKQYPTCIFNSVGYQYEFLLREKIEELQVPFLDEHDLRTRGYDKTPDFKLEVPIAVDGHIVNWIESKASFGDEHSHSKYLEDQYWSYQNRFGPGMVIYWFGYIKELDTHRSQGIMLVSAFPSSDSITKLSCQPTYR